MSNFNANYGKTLQHIESKMNFLNQIRKPKLSDIKLISIDLTSGYMRIYLESSPRSAAFVMPSSKINEFVIHLSIMLRIKNSPDSTAALQMPPNSQLIVGLSQLMRYTFYFCQHQIRNRTAHIRLARRLSGGTGVQAHSPEALDSASGSLAFLSLLYHDNRVSAHEHLEE